MESTNTRTFKRLILTAILFFTFIFFAFADAQISPTSQIVSESSNNLFNITINNTGGVSGVDNITQINFTLPSGFSFVYNTNLTNAVGANFSNTSTVLTWSNTTYWVIQNNTNNTWFGFNLTAPAQSGNYNITVTTLFSSGGLNLTNFTITVNDTLAPNVSAINSPVSNGNYSLVGLTGGSLLLNASVNDTNGLGLSSVYFNISNGTYSQFNQSAQLAAGSLYWNFTLNITNTAVFTDGLWNVTVYANDTLNNLNSSVYVQFRIDNTVPSINITNPINNTNSSNNRLNINFTVSDAGAGIGSCWYSNDTMSGNVTLTSCANITAVTWTEGQHNVTIWVNDSVNNVNQTSVRFTIDSVAPNVSAINYPISGGNYSLVSLTGGSLLLNASVNDTNGLGLSSVYFNISNGTYSQFNISAQLAAGSLYWNVTINITNTTIFVDGLWNVTVYANDTLNNLNNTIYNTFRIDNTKPAVTATAINSPVTGGNYSQNLFFNTSATDTGGSGINTLYFNISNGTYSTYNLSSAFGSGWNTTLNTTAYADGLWNVTVYATDLAGNVNSTSSVLNFRIDNTKPSLSLSSSSATTSSITVSYSCTDAGSGVASANCTLSSSGGTVSGSTISSLSCGTAYIITVTGTDNVGNSRTTSSSMSTSACAVSSGGGGGGGSVSTSNTWSTVNAGQEYKYVVGKSDIAINTVVLTPTETLSNVKLAVKQYSEKPAAITTNPVGIVFKYTEVEKTNVLNSQILNVKLTFSVDKTWVDAKGGKENVVMLRYNNNIWEKLSTRFVGVVGDKYQYEAVTIGFSYFAITYQTPEQKAVQAKQEAVKTPAESETPVGDVTQPENLLEQKEAKTTNWMLIVIVLVCVLLIGLVAYFVYKKTHGEDLGAYKYKPNRK